MNLEKVALKPNCTLWLITTIEENKSHIFISSMERIVITNGKANTELNNVTAEQNQEFTIGE